MEEMRGAYTVFDGETKTKESFLRPVNRWEDNIKTDLQEVR